MATGREQRLVGKDERGSGQHGCADVALGDDLLSESTAESVEKRIFVIAPTIYMKTKVNFRPKTIAPTILMKTNRLVDNLGEGHDVIERK
jgi:hypothetical protein